MRAGRLTPFVGREQEMAVLLERFERAAGGEGQAVLLAGEAVIDAEILTTVFKDVDRRTLPAQVPPNGSFGDTWFEAHGHWYRGIGSFPSGHTIAAFSIAS